VPTIEEGDAPTAPDPLPTEDDKSTLVKMATLWVKIDGLFERMQHIYVDWKAKMDVAGASTTGSESSASGGSSVNRINITFSEKGALILAVVFATALAAYSAARVSSLKDHIDENQQITLNAIAQHERITQNEIDHYREYFAKLERQYRMTEMKLDAWGVTARRAGLKLPGDFEMGPGGNPDAASFNIPLQKGESK